MASAACVGRARVLSTTGVTEGSTSAVPESWGSDLCMFPISPAPPRRLARTYHVPIHAGKAHFPSLLHLQARKWKHREDACLSIWQPPPSLGIAHDPPVRAESRSGELGGSRWPPLLSPPPGGCYVEGTLRYQRVKVRVWPRAQRFWPSFT